MIDSGEMLGGILTLLQPLINQDRDSMGSMKNVLNLDNNSDEITK